MNIHGKRRHLEPAVRERLALLLGDRKLSNGTRFSNAVATIVAHDLAAQPKRLVMNPEKLVGAYSDDEIRTIAAELDARLRNKDYPAFQMPSGKWISSVRHATGIYLERDMFFPWAGHEGLHIHHDIERGGHSPNVEKLQQAVYEKMQTLPSMDVPKPDLEDIKIIQDSEKWRDILIVPMRGGPGKLFDYEIKIEPVPYLLDNSIDFILSEIMQKAQEQWDNREDIDRQYEIIAEHMKGLQTKIQEEDVTFSFGGMRVHFTGITSQTIPMFTVLGNGLRPEQWSDFNWAYAKVPHDFKSIMNQYALQRRRAKILKKAKADNGRGRIDSITLAALRASNEDVAEALKKLSVKQRIVTKVLTGSGKETALNLSWRNGVVMGSFSFNKNTAWNYGSFILKNRELPASVISSLIGRRLNELVEHPFIDPSVDIRSVTGHNGGWLKINARIKTFVFNPETGEILGEEESGA